MLDTSITAVNIFAGLSESLELFVIDFEVFLAADPICVVLRHLEGVFDRWEWLHWHLVYEVAPLEVLLKI